MGLETSHAVRRSIALADRRDVAADEAMALWFSRGRREMPRKGEERILARDVRATSERQPHCLLYFGREANDTKVWVT